MRLSRRIALIFFAATLLFSQPLIPQGQSSAGTSVATDKKPKPAPNCSDNGTYVNSKGQTVKRPETCFTPPAGATAQCRDGTYSFSKSRRGTCSHHGGVAKWF